MKTEYLVECYWSGDSNWQHEVYLESVVGKPCYGTSYTYDTGIRDIVWLFDNKPAAQEACRCLRLAGYKCKIRIGR